MKSLIASLAAFAFLAASAQAASITNLDGEAYSLQITENGEQSEVAIGAGETISTCDAGCFVVMPNGDRETLSGSETVEIAGGKATVK